MANGMLAHGMSRLHLCSVLALLVALPTPAHADDAKPKPAPTKKPSAQPKPGSLKVFHSDDTVNAAGPTNVLSSGDASDGKCGLRRCSDANANGPASGLVNKKPSAPAAAGSIQTTVVSMADAPTASIRRKVLAAYMMAVKRCAKPKDAMLTSTTTVGFAINNKSHLVDVRVSGDNQAVIDCITPLAAAWLLPPPQDNAALPRFEVRFETKP